MLRFYIIPIDSVQGGKYKGPKYFKWRFNPDGIACKWNFMQYGLMPLGIILAHDIEDADNAYLESQDDVTALPLNIDNNISAGAVPIVQAELEALHIPAMWVNTTHTYRYILKIVAGLFQFAQRYKGQHARKLIEAGYRYENKRIN